MIKLLNRLIAKPLGWMLRCMRSSTPPHGLQSLSLWRCELGRAKRVHMRWIFDEVSFVFGADSSARIPNIRSLFLTMFFLISVCLSLSVSLSLLFFCLSTSVSIVSAADEKSNFNDSLEVAYTHSKLHLHLYAQLHMHNPWIRYWKRKRRLKERLLLCSCRTHTPCTYS